MQFVNARRALRLAALRAGRARARSAARWRSGLEPLYQQYFDADTAHSSPAWARPARYHFLSLGRFVPYAEGGDRSPGAPISRCSRSDSTFTFVVWAGVGASYFVTDRTALYAGYRYEHISNGNTSATRTAVSRPTAAYSGYPSTSSELSSFE